MKKKLHLFCFLFFLIACQTVSEKIDQKVSKEEIELSKYLNKTEAELKIAFGKPNQIKFKKDNKNRFYVYLSKKMNITCQRTFEINQSNRVIGFTSKNCFWLHFRISLADFIPQVR